MKRSLSISSQNAKRSTRTRFNETVVEFKNQVSSTNNDCNNFLDLIVTLNFFSVELLDYLDVSEIQRFDNAITNKKLRSCWHEYPKLLRNSHTIFSSAKQIDYCISRNIYLNRMAVMSLNNQDITKLHFFSKYLQEFWMRNCDSVTQECFVELIKKCSILKELNLLSLVNDITLQTVAVYCKEIKGISLQCETGNVTADGLKQLFENTTNLKYFCFSNGLDEMSYMDFIQSTGDPDVNVMEDISNIICNIGKYCPHLESLHLEHVPLLCKKEDGLSLCPQLKAVTIEGITFANLEFLQLMGPAFPMLECFVINPHPMLCVLRNFLSDRSIQAIIKGCPLLKRFETPSIVRFITDGAFTDIATYCPQLESIDFGLCDGITDVTFTELGKLNTLKNLGLSFCGEGNDDGVVDGVTDIGVANLVKTNKIFESINLRLDGHACTNHSIDIISENCPLLKAFTVLLTNNTNVPIKILKKLLKSCPLLVAFEVFKVNDINCLSVTPAIIRKELERRKSLLPVQGDDDGSE